MKFVASAAAIATVAGVLSIAAPASAVTHHSTVTVDERENHATVTVHKGDRIRVVLHNTYWTIDRAHRSIGHRSIVAIWPSAPEEATLWNFRRVGQ